VLRRRPRHRHADPAGLNKADKELTAADPVIGGLIADGGALRAEEDRRARLRDPYEALLRAIVGQQLSTKAAFAIWTRVLDGFGGAAPSPAELLAADPEQLRGAGLSWSKVAYARDLAERITDGELDLARVVELPDERVIEELTAIKGVGRWTAEMFLIFHLGRPDVVSTGDLGIRRAIERAYGLRKLPEPARVETMAEAWRPHRTLACLYLWRSLQNTPG
jgi:DNA-3-methyladenine glycosylase II